MNRFDGFLRWALSILIACTLAFSLGGCDGDDGAAGPAGPTGATGPDGPTGPPGPVPDKVMASIEAASPESCGTCHDGVGGQHQAIYDKYVDASNLAIEFTAADITVTDNLDGTLAIDANFRILQDGMAYADAAGLPGLDQKRFIFIQYFTATNTYGPATCYLSGFVPTLVAGEYTASAAACQFTAPATDWHVYGYIAQGALFTHEGPSSELPDGSHVHLYDNIASTAVAFGAADAAVAGSYDSAANVAGCEKCHGVPYLKHGYRAAEVDPLPDFAACKSCHYDTRSGGHEDWQYMVDQPLNWATDGLTDAEIEALYPYTANIMNDTHMSHAMEFPYPMSISNCASCHEGKLDRVIADATFTAETCVSCHALQGIDTWPKTFDADGNEILGGRSGTSSVPEQYAQLNRAPPFEYLWTHNTSQNYVALHQQVLASADPDCTVCHETAGIAPAFSAYHTGYDTSIADADGVSYATQYTVQIDLVTWDALTSTLKIDFSANDPAVVPEVLVSFYGWDSKNFIIPSHARDADRNRFEYEPGDTNPLFTDFAETAPGVWTVTANLAAFLPVETDDILTLIENDVIKNAEITITPTLALAGEALVLKAVDQTVSLQDGLEVPDYFKAGNAVVAISKCNVCHDALASSFHDGSGRAGDGIEVCKNCHNPTFPGSHIEMASRSIDSYVHAIHSFQPFDLDDIANADDPVLDKRNAQHILHTFPNFTIRNCEACHLTPMETNSGAVVYNVPDQSKSMPGVLSKSYDIADRNIGTLPEYVTGPASRACGGCHRADLINADLAGDLASFNAHTKAFGTLEENDDDDMVLFGIIDKIMSMFQ